MQAAKKVAGTALLLSALSLGQAQELPDDVYNTPAGQEWITQEFRLRQASVSVSPQELEDLLKTGRQHLVEQCSAALKAGQTCPKSMAADFLGAIVQRVAGGHTQAAAVDPGLHYFGFETVFLTPDHSTDVAIFVSRVYVGSPAERAGLKMGDQVLEVDGQDAMEAPYPFAQSEQSERQLIVRRGGKTVSLTLRTTPHPSPLLPTMEVRANIAVIRYPTFNNDRNGTAFLKLIMDAEKQKVAGLVIDLRDNGGGQSQECLLASNGILPTATVTYRQGQKINVQKAAGGVVWRQLLTKDGWDEIKRVPGVQPFQGPVAVLVNRRTASCSEVFTNLVKRAGGRVRVYGGQTAGAGNSTAAITNYDDGIYISMQFGQLFDDAGHLLPVRVTPDVAVDDTWKSFADVGHDFTLERALNDLKTGQIKVSRFR